MPFPALLCLVRTQCLLAETVQCVAPRVPMNGSPEVNEHLDVIIRPIVVSHRDHYVRGGFEKILPA